MPDAPAATPALSTTTTSSPAAARCQAVDSPWTPAPITRWRAEPGRSVKSVLRRFPAVEHRGLPIRSDDIRALNPRPQLGLSELGVGALEPDPVGVAGLQVGDQHLAGELVLTTVRDRKVDAQERVGVAVEDGGGPLLRQQLDVLEPVQILAGSGGLEVDVLHQRDV